MVNCLKKYYRLKYLYIKKKWERDGESWEFWGTNLWYKGGGFC